MEIPRWVEDIKAIGWDLDGTLYPADAIPRGLIWDRQIKVIADEHGWEVDKAERNFRKRYKKFGSHTMTMTSFGVDGVEFFTGVWDSIPLEEYIKKDAKMVKMIDSLKNLRHLVLSNSNRVDQIEKKLRLIGFGKKAFEFILSTVDIGFVKPDKRPFEAILAKTNLKADQVLFVGDRVDTDIKGAKGVGMRACLVGGDSSEADISLARVYDVEKLFRI